MPDIIELSSTMSFLQQFGIEPELTVKGPGRIEILGNHTDYNEGFVLSKTVNQCVTVSLAKIDATEVRVVSTFSPDEVKVVRYDALDAEAEKGDWIVYVQGILQELSKRTNFTSGAAIFVDSNVPSSAGMSSSAAFEVALISGLDALFGIGLNPMEIARIGQLTENYYTGARTGLMDQLTSVCGKPGSLLRSEYRNVSYQDIAFSEDYNFVVINSGVKHDLSQEYNERRAQCEEVVEVLSRSDSTIKALRDVDLKMLEENRSKLADASYRRALHVVTENERVHKGTELLAAGDMVGFGNLLYESHQSSIDNFENSCPELDQIVDLTHQFDQCLGARLSGGGFGGVVICLLKNSEREAFIKGFQQRMYDMHSKRLDVFSC